MTIKYILHTCETTDKDGNVIWIDGDRLARIYGVPMSECLIVNPDEAEDLKELIPAGATHLYYNEDID